MRSQSNAKETLKGLGASDLASLLQGNKEKNKPKVGLLKGDDSDEDPPELGAISRDASQSEAVQA